MAAESSGVFLDTNILIYAYSETEVEKKTKALSFLAAEPVVVSTQAVNEFIWVMNRKYNVDYSLLKIISDNIFDLYNVRLINRSTISKAVDFSQRLNFTFWDILWCLQR